MQINPFSARGWARHDHDADSRGRTGMLSAHFTKADQWAACFSSPRFGFAVGAIPFPSGSHGACKIAKPNEARPTVNCAPHRAILSGNGILKAGKRTPPVYLLRSPRVSRCRENKAPPKATPLTASWREMLSSYAHQRGSQSNITMRQSAAPRVANFPTVIQHIPLRWL